MNTQRKRWSLFLAGVVILLVILGLIWLTFDSVGGRSLLGTISPPVRLDLSPDEVIEQLNPSGSFEFISQEFAETLDVPVNSLQVRLQPKGCSACEMKESTELGIQPIADVSELIPESDGAWLMKDDLMCFYLLQKEQWTPKSCSIWQ
ncbi:MAG: hypothetical protein AAF702_05850 [Chloroflexota bacterium]